MPDIPINDVARRVQFTSSGSAGPYAFTFAVLSQDDVAVYSGATLKTLTTHYTVSLNANGTGSITYTSGNIPASSVIVTVTSDQAVARTSDYTSGGDFKAQTINDDLDKLTINQQQAAEVFNRTLTVPITDPVAVSMVLPAKADRLGKYLAFNVSTGNPEAGASSDDVATLAAVTSDIATLADIEDGTDATDAIQAVAAKATEVGRLGTAAAVADLAILGTADVVSDMNVLATADVVTDMNTLGTADVVSDMNTLGTSDVVADMNTLGTSAIVSDMNDLAPVATQIGLLGTSDAVADMNTLGTSDVVTDMNVLGTSANVTAMGVLGTSANVTAMGLLGVSGVITDMGILGTADVVADMNVLGTSDVVADMNTLGTSDVVADMNTLATSDVVADMNTLGTSDVVADMNTLGTSDVVADMNTLATSDVVADMNTLGTADVVSDMNTLAAIAASINNVASQAIGFTFSTTTSMADPGSGGLRFNNGTVASCTAIAIDDLDSSGADVSPYVITWDDSTNTNKGTLLIRSGAAASTFAIFTITGLTDNSGWTQLAVTHLASNGTISNADTIFASYLRSGDKGADGSGSMTNFVISDGSTTQSITDGNTMTFVDGAGINVTVSATDTVTIAYAGDDPTALALALG